jgi:CrcB protein
MFFPSEIAVVACGGALGACLRFIVGRVFETTWAASKFPIATLFVNIIGCFIIGVIAEISIRSEVSPLLRLLLVTGILGGFTTFSAFGLETVALLRAGHIFLAGTYAVGSVVGGCAATMLGMLLVGSRNIAS